MDFNVNKSWAYIPLELSKLVWDFVNSRDENFYKAAEGGHLDMLKWFHKHFAITTFCVTSAENAMFRVAARHGRLEVLKWLSSTFHLTIDDISHSRNAPFRWAATQGHLEVLVWLQKKYSSAIDDDTIKRALFFGHIHILEWIKATVDPKSFVAGICDALDCLDMACAEGNFSTETNFLRVCDWIIQTDSKNEIWKIFKQRYRGNCLPYFPQNIYRGWCCVSTVLEYFLQRKERRQEKEEETLLID